MHHIVVREYATLCATKKSGGLTQTLDFAEISETAFEYLLSLSESFYKNGLPLLHSAGVRKLKLDSFVGVIESPCGTRIEILPKHTDEAADPADIRKILYKLLAVALNLKAREAGTADLSLYRLPLHEWVMRQFLLTCEKLVQTGLRFDYLRIEEEQKYMRGQLDTSRYMRQPAARQHILPIRYDIYSVDRAENRLLKSTLEQICRSTRDASNWRLAQELRLLTAEISASRNIAQDFKQWSTGRLFANYQNIKPWCELVLGQHMPFSQLGGWRGISLLFPMEKLFEQYVAHWLNNNLQPSVVLTTQARHKSMCEHQQGQMFQLRPDLVIESRNQDTRQTIVLDTKWKRLDRQAYRYGMKDSDIQQMFAYSHFYLQHLNDVMLIYPAWLNFSEALPPFQFNGFAQPQQPKLWVLAFDLELDELRLHEKMAAEWWLKRDVAIVC